MLLQRRSVEQREPAPAALLFLKQIPGGKKVKRAEYNLLYYTGSAGGRQALSFPFSLVCLPRCKMKLLFSTPGIMMEPDKRSLIREQHSRGEQWSTR